MDASADQLPASRVVRELHQLFRSSATVAPLGTIAASAIWILIAIDRVAVERLLLWFAGMVVAACLMVAAVRRPADRSTYDQAGIPRLAYWGHLLSGILWGLVLWLDFEAPVSSDLAWKAVCVQLAVTSGTMSAANASTRLRLLVMAPMWAIGCAGALYAGEYLLAVGVVAFLLVVGNDVARLPRALRTLVTLRLQWERTAEQDPLTGLLNRAGIRRQIEARTLPTPVSALFIDLDHFKDVNDRLGHPAGDELLVQVGDRLIGCVRDDDLVGRVGGDEFLVLLDRDFAASDLDGLAHRIISEIERPFDLGGDQAMISASVGTTVDGALVASADELFQHVDHALYAAKRAGRRRVVAFDDDLRADLESRIGLGEALRRAVTGGQIEVWGQPIVDLHTGATVWIELLARWRHTDGLHIPPSVFVPLAEETGLITEITEQMLVHAMRVHRHLRCHPELASARLTVNVSPLDLVAGSLTELVAKLVEENGVQPGELVLEVTESRVLDDVDRARAVLHEVRALGVELAIDDFGSGYSSLNQLLSLPISIVKLDRSLIAGLAGNPRQLALIRSIGNLGRTVGHDVIAEGVEHEVQAEMLRRLGYTFAQGYLFARPTPITELTGMPPVGGEAPREPDRGGLPVLDGSLG